MTVVLGQPGWLTRGQVRALDRAGMTIGAHTYDHKAVPDFAGEDWTHAARPSRASELQRLLGHPIRLFAYPFGAYAADGDPAPVERRLPRRLPARRARSTGEHPLWSLRRIIVPELSGRELLREIRRDF